jgi:hypothetical protein
VSSDPWLNGGILAVSIFNIIVPLWLGWIILLTAEKRSWGVWLAAGGLFAGSAFFVCHSAILGQEITFFTGGINFWWHLAWFPLILAPAAWYIGVLWYAGYWDDHSSTLHRRHRGWLAGVILLAVALVVLLLIWSPLPGRLTASSVNYEVGPSFTGIPVLFVGYPVFIILCIILSMDTLLKPGPTRRLMGGEARRRARPWLAAVSLDLLCVSLAVSLFIGWLLTYDELSQGLPELYTRIAPVLAWLDLALQILIGGAILMVGQAVVTYEIFTGRNLPRRGLRIEWRSVILMALGASLVAAWTLSISLRPVYSMLLVIVLMVVFVGLFTGWMAREREEIMRQMRPLVASQQIVPSLLDPDNPLDIQNPFSALCRDFLGVRRACLIPLGALASLGAEPLGYPDASACPNAELEDVLNRIPSQKVEAVPLDRLLWKEMTWAVPLWSERGLIGLLLLGEKSDGGLLHQEEIEIGRLGAERLLDMQASASLSSKLMQLQRQRITDSQIVDRQTRRVLHDEILPRIHAGLLTLSSAPPFSGSQAVMDDLSDSHRQLSRLLHDLPPAADPQVQRLGLVGAIRNYVEAEAARYFSGVRWEISPMAEGSAGRLPQLEAETVYYAAREVIRNAARYGGGSEQRPLSLSIKLAVENDLILVIEDDGVGVQIESSESESTRQGLAIHSAMLALIGGTMTVESKPDRYTRVTLRFPDAKSTV